ncbi:putative nuclease HARBI1 [Gymnodraco acuticeps]|uniref:Putative nuclease HARBI1 n=1 Tax=Gymnodraco acuticeps TaxID=8218 RepID=A0A6P8UMB8_GYMAC|nr:putative nuclease HARBI1 [Gymnodraco acuticeps]
MAGIVHIFHAGRRGYRQRVHTERPKPLQQYTTEELYNRFPFGLDDINYIADLVRPQLQCRTLRSHALTVEEQILIALRFYACGTFYEVIADSMGVHRTTVGEVVTAVSDALARLLDHFVTFPTDGQIAKVKQNFFLLGDMPNTIGVIDCTHVHIQAPRQREWEYVNRKGRHSINVQLVGDADLAITNCVARWPGSVHDARIFRESRLFTEFQTNRPDGVILADSAYPLLPWVMTPFPMANTPSQMRYNIAHGRTRCAIERLNGVLKRRFACLNYLRVEPQGACQITLACIVLHNIAVHRRVPLSDIDDPPEPLAPADDLGPPMDFPLNERLSGGARRDAIVCNYF